MVLTKMKEFAQSYLGITVTSAVVTVPASPGSTTRSVRQPMMSARSPVSLSSVSSMSLPPQPLLTASTRRSLASETS